MINNLFDFFRIMPFFAVLFFLCVAILIFFISREVICWYYKVNVILETLKLIQVQNKELLEYIKLNEFSKKTDEHKEFQEIIKQNENI